VAQMKYLLMQHVYVKKDTIKWMEFVEHAQLEHFLTLSHNHAKSLLFVAIINNWSVDYVFAKVDILKLAELADNAE
jgi:hypothetical protein